MVLNFRNAETEAIYNGEQTRASRRLLPVDLWKVAQRKLDMLHRAGSAKDLTVPPKNRLEALKGDRRGQHSIRINSQYRICFVWTEQGPQDVEIVDYH